MNTCVFHIKMRHGCKSICKKEHNRTYDSILEIVQSIIFIFPFQHDITTPRTNMGHIQIPGTMTWYLCITFTCLKLLGVFSLLYCAQVIVYLQKKRPRNASMKPSADLVPRQGQVSYYFALFSGNSKYTYYFLVFHIEHGV